MRKKSKYRPKYPADALGMIDPLSFVLSGAKPLSEVGEEALKLKLKNHEAVHRLQQGMGTKQDVEDLKDAMNMTYGLLKTAKLGVDWYDEINAALDAVQMMASRGLATGHFVFRGPELTAVNLALEVHDAQIDNCTVFQMEKAVQFVKKELRLARVRVISANQSDIGTP